VDADFQGGARFSVTLFANTLAQKMAEKSPPGDPEQVT
jgi:hypothetical protein